MHHKYYKNWKTVHNIQDYCTESENPILKKDEHHAEIVDITDGLVVEEQTYIPEYNLENHEKLRDDDIGRAFGNAKL